MIPFFLDHALILSKYFIPFFTLNEHFPCEYLAHVCMLELQEATVQYMEVAKKHGLTPVELSLGFARDRPFMTSSIVGATSVDQLKEDIDAFLTLEQPLLPEVMADNQRVFN